MMHIAFRRRSGIRERRGWLCSVILAAGTTLVGHAAGAQTRTVSLGATPTHAWMNDARPFWRDSQWDLHFRTYYLDRDNFNGTIDQAWAGGGWIGWQSGFAHDVLQIGATLYTSQPIYAPEERGGTLLLDDQDQITTLGQAWVRARINKQDLTIGRHIVDTPLIGLRDNRMIPITYEGVTLKGTPVAHPNMTYWLGYLWDFKPRDSPYFQSMSSGGFDVPEETGAIFVMVRGEPMNGWHFVAEDYFVADTINTGYGEARYDFPKAKDGPAWTLAINDILQTSVGENLITGDPFFTHQASAKIGVVYNSWTLFLAGSTTDEGADIRFPYASKPNYTDMQQVSFDRAGEDAVVVGAAYDFTRHGWKGLTAGASFGHGVDAINPFTGDGLPDRSEYDIFVQYRPPEGHWEGLRLQAKYANVFGDGLGVRDNQPELRLIADYVVLLKR